MSAGLRFTHKHPTTVVFERGSLNRLGELVKGLGGKALVVTGRQFAKKYGYDSLIKSQLESAGVEVYFFSEVEPNPTIETADRCAEAARKAGVDFFVAFGGGSVIDVAKAANVVYSLGGSAKDYLWPRNVEEKLRPLVAVPTTHGTGSEVTKYSVLVDRETGMKVAVSGSGLLPTLAVLDPLVLKHLPSDQSASTGLDALSHAIEAFFSSRATPFTDMFALEASRIAFRKLPCAVEGFLDCREWMLYASMLAGYAINYTGTNIGHGLGYPLTTRLNLPHGFANTVPLLGALEYYEKYAPERARLFAEHVGATGVGGLRGLFKELCREVGAPTSLSGLGVRREELDDYVREGLKYKRNLSNAPFEVTEEIVRDIYERVF
ncbi:iron-containing alcohol dehydrogenase [Thermofilum pendens]|uniref:Iron-containing alcohol dehydrogenase n=1 Tax=Thermofilum pendens (strain DSM 2475 / Hrk 5) TaxID=368408 RepID=A1RYX6_THEPD|nr:iron-containing alcohol dehydrogenase [Thermofilum pendens]ABL78406.1 iron-containing alcohol dehydrogenase [Thermofilum pendens Hrk 5]